MTPDVGVVVNRRVGAGVSVDEVGAGSAADDVVIVAAKDGVVAAETVDGVVAAQSVDCVATIGDAVGSIEEFRVVSSKYVCHGMCLFRLG